MKPIPVEYQHTPYEMLLSYSDPERLRAEATRLRAIGRKRASNDIERIYASRLKREAQRIERTR